MSHYDPQRDRARSGQARAAPQSDSHASDRSFDWDGTEDGTAPDSQSTYAGQTSPAQGVREERRATPSSRQILESNGVRGLRQGSQSGAPTNAPCAGTAMESANPPNKSPAVLREEKRKEDQEKELEQLERKICTADADIQSLQIELDTITREKANRAREEADRREQTLVNCEQCKSREENINALRDAIDKTKNDLSELEEEENSQGEQLASARQRAEATIAEEQRKQETLTKRKNDLVNLKRSIADLDKERQAKPKKRISVKEEHIKRYHLVNKECEYQNCKKRLTPDRWYCCHECSDCNFCGACFEEAWKRHAGGMHSFTDMTDFTGTVANTHLEHIKSALEKIGQIECFFCKRRVYPHPKAWYRCNECRAFDMCGDCFNKGYFVKHVSNTHNFTEMNSLLTHGHGFPKISQIVRETPSQPAPETPVCKCCAERHRPFFRCMSCTDYTLCQKCISKEEWCTHSPLGHTFQLYL